MIYDNDHYDDNTNDDSDEHNMYIIIPVTLSGSLNLQ